MQLWEFQKINPEMIVLARKARAMTQSELAQKLTTSQSNISKIEQGTLSINLNLLNDLSTLLNYPSEFFFQSGNISNSPLFYRRKLSIGRGELDRLEAIMNLVRLIIEKIDVKNLLIQHIKLNGNDSPNSVAIELRKNWNLGTEPISNLACLLEEKGIIIVGIDFKNSNIDGRTATTKNNVPIIFYNTSMPKDRQRFTLAHELGHTLLHTESFLFEDIDIENEANQFAAEFLIPENEFIKDFKLNKLDIPSLARMKKKWKVSMASIVVRAKSLNLITGNQYEYIWKNFNKMGFRMNEPIEILEKEPIMLTNILCDYAKKIDVSIDLLHEKFFIPKSEFYDLFKLN